MLSSGLIILVISDKR